mmetsp:Transcript_113085/g.200534  ORF Transcript_113085/g.200534 Transcript_113085/m.200534 type:complete len:287 (+) Transcript_113085:91-951(+)
MDMEFPLGSEASLLGLAPFLDPGDTWRLQLLSAKICQMFSQEMLIQLRKIWSFNDVPPLVDMLKAAEPYAPQPAQQGLLRMVGLRLLADPSAARFQNSAGQTAISWAADYGLTKVLKLLLSPLAFPKGCDPRFEVLQCKEANGWYPLFRAAWNGRTDCVRELLAAQADPEGVGSGPYSPLIAAARWGHQGAVAALLDARADATRKNKFGEDALTLARSQRHYSVVQLLREKMEKIGADSVKEEDTDWKSQGSVRTRHTLGQGWINLGSDFYNGEGAPNALAFARVG